MASPIVADNGLRQENKNIVTPYAFSVAPDLLSLPLASPWKRAVAIVIDLIVIALLSALEGFFLILSLTVGLYLFGWRKAKRRWLRRLLFVTLFILGLITLTQGYGLVERTLENHSSPLPVALSTPGNSSSDKTPLSEHHAAQKGKIFMAFDPGTESSQHLFTWALAALDGLGLSLGWSAVYFSFLTTRDSGRTIGKRIMGLRVVLINGHAPNLWESFGRYGGYGAGLSTGLLGFLQIFWDRNRQAIQDKISETLVIDEHAAKKLLR